MVPQIINNDQVDIVFIESMQRLVPIVIMNCQKYPFKVVTKVTSKIANCMSAWILEFLPLPTCAIFFDRVDEVGFSFTNINQI